ncbi:hypothetical protein B0T19DRAFT_208807 [Cercophora scortea]|uniref:Uncharacterized protein n=1 Tax=Cercophora scortea TaxID=314031 RepID=A0AAE0M979_9PEZI|nr:hypothetical protein B0T19DRAFT_208807 [Cercophora scortea]
MNLQIADPTIPAPGEMISDPYTSPGGYRASSPRPISPTPNRHRAPSLGELHQTLENEQEFHVNRLLTEIRRVQQQVERQQPSAAGGELPERSMPVPIPAPAGSAPHSAYPGPASGSSLPRSPGFPRSSFDLARADLHNRRSRTPSRGASPRLRSTSISGESGEQWILGGRDESAFYQAETQMLVRENQMLRHRIRELERQLCDATGTSNTVSITHEPSHASHLSHSTSVSEEHAPRATPTGPAQTPAAVDVAKDQI